MYTKSVKVVIIVIMVLANLFFVFNIMSLKIKTERVPAEMLSDSEIILKKNGYVIEDGAVPNIKPAYYIYEGEYTRMSCEKTAESLARVDRVESAYPMPSGDIIYIASGYRFEFFSVDSGDLFLDVTITKTDSEITSDYANDQVDLLTKAGISGADSGQLKVTKKIIAEFLHPVSAEDADFKITGYKRDGDKCLVAAEQMVDKLNISSHSVYVEIEDGVVTAFCGKWYFGGFTEIYREPLLDSVNILIKSLSGPDRAFVTSGVTLTEMRLSYYIIRHETGKFYFIPAWELHFESNTVLVYNAWTGDKILTSAYTEI